MSPWLVFGVGAVAVIAVVGLVLTRRSSGDAPAPPPANAGAPVPAEAAPEARRPLPSAPPAGALPEDAETPMFRDRASPPSLVSNLRRDARGPIRPEDEDEDDLPTTVFRTSDIDLEALLADEPRRGSEDER